MTKKDERWIDWNKLKGLSDDEIEKKAKEILSIMTLKEKAHQMSGDESLITGGPRMAKRYNDHPLPAGRDKNLGIPGINFSDGPRGVVMGASTCFPVSMARGASWDLELEEKIGNAIGIEAKAQGAHYFGGVCINLLRHPAWGRAQESYGEDTHHLGAFGSALTMGVQKHIMACAKHYACNSMENMRFKVNVSVGERTLREIYLSHFKDCVDVGVASIMNAYNKVNGKYCGHNPHLLTDILKQDWGFKGFVITDFLLGIRDGKKAVNAGVDVEMPFHWRMKVSKLLKLLKKGEISEEQINESVLRILRMKLKFAHEGEPTIYNMEKVACKEHIQLALETARKGTVLLKNENNILPLDRNKIKKITVVGKLADMENLGDHGSSRVYPPYVITPLEGIKNLAGSSIEVLHDDGKVIERAMELTRDSDMVIIVAGYTYRDEGEYTGRAGDRPSLTLRPEDEALISKLVEVNDNCIVIMEGGSAIITEAWKDKVKGILMAWYPGMEGGTALAEIIFGDVNPSAKLPMVFPKSQEQLPFLDIAAREIEYGYYHGYNLMDKEGNEPAFPFGFGLSYTTYSYDNLNISKISMKDDDILKVSVDVTNTGKVAGEEIVQLYVGYKGSSVERHVKDLKGFGKLSLKPGETKTLTMDLKASQLAYYDVDKKDWVVEKIEYLVHVGPSSQADGLLTASFKVQ
jgi:beta-glucosidase